MTLLTEIISVSLLPLSPSVSLCLSLCLSVPLPPLCLSVPLPPPFLSPSLPPSPPSLPPPLSLSPLQLEIEDFVPGLLYFGYSLIMVFSFWLLTGTIGFFATYAFVRHIYAAVKIDWVIISRVRWTLLFPNTSPKFSSNTLVLPPYLHNLGEISCSSNSHENHIFSFAEFQ